MTDKGVTSNVVTPRENQGAPERPLDEDAGPGWEPGMADQQDTDAMVEQALAEESKAKDKAKDEAPAAPPVQETAPE